ncbi:hypothetical protein [Streptomyces sp. NPDC087297]|uniref:hypothetical protein n=1 Tax=Streptomyces sp. NPDC087297 TaxID=3365778 RepID=UPI00381498D4
MSRSNKQTQLQLEPEVLEAGIGAAAARGLDFNQYVQHLITEDTTSARAAGIAAAVRLMDTHADFLQNLEEAVRDRRDTALTEYPSMRSGTVRDR